MLAEALGDPHRLGVGRGLSARPFWVVCDPDHALASGQRALAIAATWERWASRFTAQYYLGQRLLQRGGLSSGDRVAATERGVSPRRTAPGALRPARSARRVSRSGLVVSLAECGAFTEGRRSPRKGCGLPRLPITPIARVVAYWAMGFRALRQGDLPQALPVLERALDLAQERTSGSESPGSPRLGGGLYARRTDRRGPAAAGAGGRAGRRDAF